jgi:TfoX/Sxy family transcriptional regulator of competence genes
VTIDEKLAANVRAHLSTLGTIGEVEMFGGPAFKLNDNMVAAVSKRGLLLRIGKEQHERALARPGVRAMEMRGRTIQGYVYVDPEPLTDVVLRAWLDEAAGFTLTLPPKVTKRKSTRKGKRK